MTYIKTGIQSPGIVELLFYKGPTGKALSNLAQTLLHGPSQLNSGERELIAAYVSKLNNCEFCTESHGSAASIHFNDGGQTVSCTLTNPEDPAIPVKMRSLLLIAKKVQKSGREVKLEDIENAKKYGATDEEIHDTILIAAAFCMYNRYVDGLGTNLPSEKNKYITMGKRMAIKGYKYPPLFLRRLVIWKMNQSSD